MATRAPGAGARNRPAWRRIQAGVAIAAFAGAVVVAAVPAPVQAREDTADEPVISDVTMVQANVYTGLTVPKFQADVATVLSLQPDFVTYNEVPFRNDAVMAPEGYDIYRDMTDRFTSATPVAWRSDRWTAIDHGVWMLSDWRGKPPGREVELGRRYANWVTLQGVDGRVVSVVSAHVAPLVNGMPDLVRRSVANLGVLVDTLSASGPVLVGGDFNVHYTSGRYPRDLLTEHSLVPTYDVMGSYFPTGDHQGATIDYVFDRGTDVLLPDSQYPVELWSDHDAVVAGLSWTTDPPTDTQVVANDPAGDRVSQRAALTTIQGGLRTAEPGSTVDLASFRFELPTMVRLVGRAIDRGVHVRVRIAGGTPRAPERRLARVIAGRQDPGSWLHRSPSTARPVWKEAGVPPSFMMVSDPTGAWTTRYDGSRKLAPELIERSSRVRISTGALALEDGRQLLRTIG